MDINLISWEVLCTFGERETLLLNVHGGEQAY